MMGAEWKRPLRAAMLAGVMLMASVSTQAWAQARAYDIQAQPLADALREYGRTSGHHLLFTEDLVRGKTAPRVRGTYSPEAALDQLLRGSGLRAEHGPDGTIMIRPAPRPGVGPSQSGDTISANEDADQHDIVVTGSRIRGAQSPSPITSRTRQELQNAGFNDMGDVIRSLTQNYSGGQNPGVTGGGAQGGQINLNSSSTLNLRGLGADTTLTLINGHRVAYDALIQGVDISAIPVAAIERFEVVTDGASALYGSDAVGGVANIILRRDFDGLETSARFGAATDGGYEQQQYNAVTGARWTTGGFMIAADFSRNTAIDARDRDYTASLDDSATLVPSARQVSIVAAGHQDIMPGVAFELDAQFNDRRSARATAFLATDSAFSDGSFNRPQVQSYSITPTVRLGLPAGWAGVVSGTYASSDTDIGSQRFADGVEVRRGQLYYDNRLHAIEVNAEGPLFETSAGAVRLALGGGYRSVRLGVLVTSITDGVTTTSEDITAHQNVYYGFGELSLPLVGPANRMPLLEALTLSAAARYENYRGVGDVLAPKLGIIYDPHPDISLRATWGRSFKAQTLYQAFQAREADLLPGEYFIGFPADRNVLILSGGNPGLKPERATSWTISVELRPVHGLTLEATYFNVHYRDRVASPLQSFLGAFADPLATDFYTLDPNIAQVNAAVASAPEGLSNQTGQPFDPATVGAIVDDSLRNISSQNIQGVDVAANYRLDLGPDQNIRFVGNASYLQSRQRVTPEQPSVQLAGTIFNPPHWRWRAGATWQRSNVTLSSFVNYIGGNLDDRIQLQPFERVGAFTSVDIVGRIRSTATSGAFRGVEAIVSVTNLLNEKPAFIRVIDPSDPPYDSTNYSSVGRVISLTLRKTW
jgi:outer membrane receptor protein involved in Fe transport